MTGGVLAEVAAFFGDYSSLLPVFLFWLCLCDIIVV